ncbi:MAG TPA: alpha/beta hydrolase [Xanthobacteraceae bacterium]|nr:alpha/beta hydrolase [Xanthobacteraceae bacterium]
MQLDPDAQVLLDAALKAGRPPIETLTPVEARRQMKELRAALKQPQPPVADVRDLAAEGPHGAIPLRLYRSRGDGTLPVVVFFHGGGWVFGDIETHDNLCRSIANAADCAVVSVDYRLAPEHKFPAAVDDSWAALQWVAARAGDLALDRARIAVAGDSAGGNLATVVSLLAAQDGGVPVRHQVLLYPTVDLGLAHDSFRRAGARFNLTANAMAWFRAHYLNGDHEVDDWRASPLRAKDLSKLPPAYVATAGCDPLCDEGEAYARALERHGVPVTFRHFPGQMHGFAGMSGFVTAADEVVADVGAALKQAWGVGGADTR